MKFQTTILQSGKNTTGIEVPPEVVEALGSGKRPAVTVTLRGYTYRNTVAVMGGKYMLSVSAEVREKAGLAGGDEVEVELQLDSAPREVELPEDVAAALAAQPEAKRFFDSISYSQKRWFVMPIGDAKTPETRQRRIEEAVGMLKEGKGQR
jgi:antitoxin component of MazEF toxin-antitoxin module